MSPSKVTEEGISTDPGKVNKLTLGLSQRTKDQKLPWTCLLLLPVHLWLINCSSNSVQANIRHAKKEFVWIKERQLAFDSLKGSLTSARVLAYLTRGGKFVLDTDTSGHETGLVLSQLKDGKERHNAFLQVEHCLSLKELVCGLMWPLGSCQVCQATSALPARYKILHLKWSCPLRSVIKAKDPEWTSGMLDWILKYFQLQMMSCINHHNSQWTSHQPCDDCCKWGKGWKFHKQTGVFCSCGCPNSNVCP